MKEGWQQHWFNSDYDERIDIYKNNLSVGGQLFTRLDEFDFEKWRKEQVEHIELVEMALKKHKEIFGGNNEQG